MLNGTLLLLVLTYLDLGVLQVWKASHRVHTAKDHQGLEKQISNEDVLHE